MRSRRLHFLYTRKKKPWSAVIQKFLAFLAGLRKFYEIFCLVPSIGLIILRGQSVSGHVVPAKMCCFPSFRLGYVTELNWPRWTGESRRGTRQGNIYICSFEQLFTSKNKVVRYSYPHGRFTRRTKKGRGGGDGREWGRENKRERGFSLDSW